MVQLGGSSTNHVLVRQPHVSKVLERFRALRPEKFDGMVDLWKVEQRLWEIDLIYDTIECTDQEKRRTVTFQLTYTVADLWESEKDILGEEVIWRMTWITFKAKFLEKYFLITKWNDKRNEFLESIQGNMRLGNIQRSSSVGLVSWVIWLIHQDWKISNTIKD